MSEEKSNIPKKNSRNWTKNEKLISKEPVLRRARDISEGFKPSSGITTGANDEQYKAGYDKIQWNKNKPKPSFKVRVNGKVINDEEE
tara:strand:- start:5540 stop:5800 length:261 start_codon:yes stop_codon:yes gene_type:complete